MDETLKARLIGASILVVLAVVLVPELLSGRKQAAGVAAGENARGTRTYTIDLGGAVAAGSRLPAEPNAPAAAAPEAVPSTGTEPAPQMPDPAATPADGEPASASRETPAPSSAVPEPAPAARPLADEVKPAAASVAPVKGGLAVQVGAFGSAATARKLADDLQGAGYSAYVAPLAKAGKTLYRVRVGPVADRAAADKLVAQLEGRKLPATVVTGG
jgi:DedD protein